MLTRYAETKLCKHGLMTYNPNDAYVGRSLQVYGEFSEAEVQYLLEQISEDSVIVDVGANIGAITVPMAQKCHKGRVISIEPMLVNFHFLCANVVTNSLLHVVPIHAAAGTECKNITVPFLDPRKPHNFGGMNIQIDAPGMPTQMLTIDSLGLNRCDLIKIDVEGMEPDVLKGAAETIKKFRPLLYVEADREESYDETVRLLTDYRYDIVDHKPPLFAFPNYTNQPKNLFGIIVSHNLICRPRPLLKPDRNQAALVHEEKD